MSCKKHINQWRTWDVPGSFKANSKKFKIKALLEACAQLHLPTLTCWTWLLKTSPWGHRAGLPERSSQAWSDSPRLGGQICQLGSGPLHGQLKLETDRICQKGEDRRQQSNFSHSVFFCFQKDAWTLLLKKSHLRAEWGHQFLLLQRAQLREGFFCHESWPFCEEGSQLRGALGKPLLRWCCPIPHISMAHS